MTKDDTAHLQRIVGSEDAGMSYVPPPAEQGAHMFIEMGKMQATLTILAGSMSRMEANMASMVPRSEYDKRHEDMAADIKDLQRWRDMVLQSSGKDRLDIEQSITGVGRKRDETTITQSQAIIIALLTLLIGAIFIIAQHH